MAAVRFLFFFIFCFLPLSLSLSETEALLKLKQSFIHGDALRSWVPNLSPCSGKWAGVICFDGTITGLHLTGLGLGGNIDVDALVELHGLRTISFVNNSFSGPIPDFHRLGALKSLLLTGNQFSGNIPEDYFSHITSLKKVWLSYNRLNGTIPESVTELSHLIELHLENNEFTGRIPPINISSLKQLDMSNNMLEGEIPKSLSIFAADTFAGNGGLCGKPLDKVCTEKENGTSTSENKHSNNTILVLMFLGTILFLFMFFAFGTYAKERKHEDFDILGSGVVTSDAQMVEMRMASSNRSGAMDHSSRKGDTKKGSSRGNNGMADLIMLNVDNGTFGLPDLMKASAEVLGNGGLGSAYKAVMANGLSVVVKRMREMNTLQREGFDAEMKRFGRLRHQNILTPLAYHFRREEKLLVSEFIPKGSLLYVLHGDRGTSHADLNWPTRLKIIQGIARGMGFLHTAFPSYDLPHGNLKSSNVFLRDDYEPLLNDYCFNSLATPPIAAQALFAYKSPDYIQFQRVSPKSDVYCLGIIILEVLTGKFPSYYLSNGKGGTDVVQWVLTAISEERVHEVLDPEIVSNTSSINHMVQLLNIGVTCIESNPKQRLNMGEAIKRIEEIQT
ncbi:hypothetical protein F2P56_022723 [Juglans regia]|uniref:Pollen receptor-like kinase 3 n=2 Tax=Juglans regia TaxID=51240 RepID=A0A2I4DE79_JUGRE|nr:pollen receptor-like kinase 3 [Juglans regia]KAF5458710.1 hypothetical protein F2P56_022723 [Juglans regia]